MTENKLFYTASTFLLAISFVSFIFIRSAHEYLDFYFTCSLYMLIGFLFYCSYNHGDKNYNDNDDSVIDSNPTINSSDKTNKEKLQ